MNGNEISRISFIAIIFCLIAGAYLDTGFDLQTGLEDNLSLNGDRWIKKDSELIATGAGWAGYGKSCDSELFTLRFKLENLKGRMNANINMNGSDSYAIGFVNNGNGSLNAYLAKRKANEPLSSRPQSAGGSKILNQTQVTYDPSQKYQVEIVHQRGNIQVLFYKADPNLGGISPMIDYYDFYPLAPGKIDFETIEDSSVRISEITVVCSPEKEEESKSLGVGYFKKPSANSLVGS